MLKPTFSPTIRSGRLTLMVLMVLVLFGSPACKESTPTPDPGPQPGEVISSTLLNDFDQAEVKSIYDNNLYPDLKSENPKNGVEIYQVVYYTPDPQGNMIQASGALVIPKGLTGSLPLLSYQHGTQSQKAGAPSAGFGKSGEIIYGLLFAGDGLVVTLPDYLGLGLGEGIHYYVHSESEASASRDLMRAARTICEERGITLDKEIFIAGYSQGGHATAALQVSLERDNPDEFPLTASAPLAAPYDLSGSMFEKMFNDTTAIAGFFGSFTLVTYNPIYDLYDDPIEVYQPPYDQTVPPAFDGSKSLGEITPLFPSNTQDIYQPQFRIDVGQNLDHPFRKALVENDLTSWIPKSETFICHCGGDDIVPFENSQKAYDIFSAAGAPVTLNVPNQFLNHALCSWPAIEAARIFILDRIK